jgi:putative peptide zinc metalloprotease protein
MTQQLGTTTGEETRVNRRPPEGTEVPVLATGVGLIGEYQSSGYKEAPCLVRRADGQTIQLTPLLYALVELVDGRRDTGQIAAELSRRIERTVSDGNVRYLVAEKLRPAGLVKDARGRDPEVRKANPLLALRFRLKLADEHLTNRLTAPFAVLFKPWVAGPVVAGFVAVVGWTFFVRGLGGGTRELLYSPALTIGAFVLTILSASFHEFGHAAACRYSGGRPGAMGCGVYLVWPAFYTDVTDAYRLDRAGRLRTDLGGLYFNAIFAVATFGVWAVTGVEALLVMIPLQVLQMLPQLLPFVRMDGYHILSDLVGVPDLFARIKPTLLGLVPGARGGEKARVLKPWVRAVVALWVLTVVPLLAFSLVMVVISAPRVLATTWDSVGLQWRSLQEALAGGRWTVAAVGVLGVVALALPVMGAGYSLLRLGRRSGAWAWTSAGSVRFGQPALALAAVALAGGLAFTWWPNGEYRPIQPGERGTVAELAQGVRNLATGRPALTPQREAELGGAPARAWTLGSGDAPAPPAPVAPDVTPTTASTTAPPTTAQPSVSTSAPATATTAPTPEPSTTTTTVARTTTTALAVSSSVPTTTIP